MTLITSPQWSGVARWSGSDVGRRQIQLAPQLADLGPDERDPRRPFPTTGWVRLDALGVVARAIAHPPVIAHPIGPFDLPALFPIELPCMIEVAPLAPVVANTTGVVNAVAVAGAIGGSWFLRRYDLVAMGGGLVLDAWVKSALLYAAGATGQWFNAGGVLLGTFPGGSLPSPRPPQAATLTILGAPSGVLQEW
jgi:hypothetical protein